MDADTSAKFINSVVKSIQSVCHGYVEFKDHIKVIGHLYLSVDSALNHNYIVNEQVCKNDRESSTMFLSNSYHSEPPAKKTTERDKRRAVSSKTKQDIRESETRLAAPSDMGHVESDVMLFAAENFPPQSTSESFQYTSQPHRSQPANKRKRTLSGGADLGASGQSVEADVAAQIVGLIDQDLTGSAERNAVKARRLSEGDSRVPDNGQDVLSFSLSGGGDSGAGDWDVNASLQAGAGLSASNKDGSVQESASASGTSRAGPTATVSRAPSADQSKDSNPPSRASSTPSVKEEPQVDVDLTIVKEEEAPTSQSSCMQSGKGGSSQPLPGASNANYSSGQWDLPGHLQQQQDIQSRVMRLDPNSSSVEYSSPPTGSTSQAQDPTGLNMLDNAQLYPVMLHPNTAASQDILSAVSMVEGRSMGQTLPSVMSFSTAGAMPSTSGHRMDMGPKPGGPRPGRLPRNMADQYGLCWHHGQQMVASSDGQFELHQAYNSYEEFEVAFEIWKRNGCHPMRTESSNILRELDPDTNQRFRYSTIKFVCVHFGKPRLRGLGIRPPMKPRQQGCDVMVRVKYYVDCGKLHITRLVDKHNHETSPELYRSLTQS